MNLPAPKPLTRSDIRVDAVYDIETENWDTFVVGGIRFSDGAYECYDWKDEALFARRILQLSGTVWAHYGGGFDHKWLLDHAARWGERGQVAAAGSRIIYAKVGRLTLADSFAVAPVSLKELTQGCGVSKQEWRRECLKLSYCEPDCVGFCHIRRDAPPETMERIKDYLKADCESLWQALVRLREFARVADIDLKKTVGSSAWAHAQRMLKLPNADLSLDAHDAARKGYYGGRVEVFRRGHIAQGYEYDVRSMYPWSLRENPLPTGRATIIFGSDAAAHIGREGIFDCTVKVPPQYIPPLPLRTKKRIYYPTGVFRGQWAKPELENAITMGGASIHTVHSAVTWGESEIIFAPWVDAIFGIRHDKQGIYGTGGADSPLGTFAKFYANSLTGKLGMNPERWTYYMNPSEIIGCLTPEICGGDCQGACGSMGQISEHIWRKRVFMLGGCMHVHWAAYLTAYARVRLFRQLVDGQYEDACYCDTDSVFSTQPRTWNVGANIGQFELKRKFRGAHDAETGEPLDTFVAPKVYCMEDEKGARKVKAKGMPKSIARMTRLPIGVEISRGGVLGWGQASKRDRLFERSTVTRTLNPRVGGRILVNSDTGETRAMSIQEALADSKNRG